MNMIRSLALAFWKEEQGQDIVEYSLLLSLFALAGLGLAMGTGTSVKSVWTRINISLISAAS